MRALRHFSQLARNSVLAFSRVYAEQNDDDYRSLREATATGRIHAENIA